MIETIHASCVAIGGRGVLLSGRSGSGKSDLALRLIDRGASLVSDDYTLVEASQGRLVASAPDPIRGRIEVRGVGILDLPSVGPMPVCLFADLAAEPERLPDGAASFWVAGIAIPAIRLRALEPSAPIKLEQALLRFGLPIA